MGAKGADFVWEAFPNIEFAVNEATVQPSETHVISRIATYLKENPTFKVELEGYTDPRGAPDYNLRLSSRRVEAVRQALIAEGVEKDRIAIGSYGKLTPKCEQANEVCWHRERRVEVIVLPVLPGEASASMSRSGGPLAGR